MYIITLSCTWRIYALSERLLVLSYFVAKTLQENANDFRFHARRRDVIGCNNSTLYYDAARSTHVILFCFIFRVRVAYELGSYGRRLFGDFGTPWFGFVGLVETLRRLYCVVATAVLLYNFVVACLKRDCNIYPA